MSHSRKLFTAILICMGMAVVACSGKQEKIDAGLINNPATPDGVDENVARPVITFDEIEHDFGTLKEGEIVSYTYTFTNTGNANLIISSVVPGCGCTVADFTKTPIPPKKKGEVAIAFNSKDKKGMQRKRVSVQANTYPAETVLWFTADVEEP